MKRITAKITGAVLALTLMCALPAINVSAAVAGDVDGDNQVTAYDARLALRASVGLEKYSKNSAKFKAADYDGDGSITSQDARSILRLSVGLPGDNSTGSSQYDILRSGKFYLTGKSVIDDTAYPITIGIDGTTVYLAMSEGSMSMGYLVKGKDIYLLNTNDKIYWKPNAIERAFLKSQGLPDADEVRNEVSEYGFTSLKPLSSANTVGSGKVNGVSCTVYTYRGSDGSTYRVYMNGNKLLALESRTAANVQDMYLRVESISATLPTLPPSDYRSVISAVFIASLA